MKNHKIKIQIKDLFYGYLSGLILIFILKKKSETVPKSEVFVVIVA